MSLRMYGSCHQNPSSLSTSLFKLDLSFVYPGVSFRVTPINAIPIIPTALSKNLCSPLSISEVQGEAKSGLVGYLFHVYYFISSKRDIKLYSIICLFQFVSKE